MFLEDNSHNEPLVTEQTPPADDGEAAEKVTDEVNLEVKED